MAVSSGDFEIGAQPRVGRSVSIDHAAALLRVSRRTIYNRIRDGALKTIRTLGGSQRVLIDSLQVHVLCDVRVTAAAAFPENQSDAGRREKGRPGPLRREKSRHDGLRGVTSW